MFRTILAVIVFAFTLAVSGAHKLAYNSDIAHADTAQMEQMVHAKTGHCCDSHSEKSEVEKPRCLADNCLFSTASIAAPFGHQEKLRFATVRPLLKPNPAAFLRPPIV